MIVNVLCFVGGVGLPYFAEKVAYQKWRSTHGSAAFATVSHGYGRRILWDAAYYFVLLSSAYRMIFSDASLSWPQWLGYTVFLCGVGLRVVSLQSLGRFYDAGITIRRDHQLIRSGHYQALRHPLHVGTLLKISGLAAFSALSLAFPVILASLFLAVHLNRMEDLLHLDRFGPTFKEYYCSTWDVVDLFYWKSRTDFGA